MPDDGSPPAPENSSRDLLAELMGSLLHRGKQELKKFTTDGRRRLDLRSLQRDRTKMYEKLGREVENLFAAGEVSHPGLLRGVERIQQLEQQISELKAKREQ